MTYAVLLWPHANVRYFESMKTLAEGELTRYANDMQLYNAALAEFAAHYKAAHRPLARGQFLY